MVRYIEMIIHESVGGGFLSRERFLRQHLGIASIIKGGHPAVHTMDEDTDGDRVGAKAIMDTSTRFNI